MITSFGSGGIVLGGLHQVIGGGQNQQAVWEHAIAEAHSLDSLATAGEESAGSQSGLASGVADCHSECQEGEHRNHRCWCRRDEAQVTDEVRTFCSGGIGSEVFALARKSASRDLFGSASTPRSCLDATLHKQTPSLPGNITAPRSQLEDTICDHGRGRDESRSSVRRRQMRDHP